MGTHSTVDIDGDDVQTVQSLTQSSGGYVWKDKVGRRESWLNDGPPLRRRIDGVPDSGYYFFTLEQGQHPFSSRLTGDRILTCSIADPEVPGGHVWRDDDGSYWKLWVGTNHGFNLTHRRWSVPDSGLADGFFTAFSAHGPRWWQTIDLNSDGRPELIQTGSSALNGGFVWQNGQHNFWKVWFLDE